MSKAGAQAGLLIIHNLSELARELEKIEEDTAEIERLTISDLKTKVPPLINKSVSQIYNIKKNEVTRANYKTQSKFADRRKVALSTSGRTIAELTFYFRGRRHADWATTAKPKPKPAKSSKVFSNKKKYTVYQEVLRGKKTPIQGKGNNRVFIANIGGKLVPMIVTPAENKPRIKGSSSVPDAIVNQQVEAIWRPELNMLVSKLLHRHAQRHSSGAIYPEPEYGG